MSTSGLKTIAPVPTATDFLDIVLSRTQRKTPTVIHKNFKISRIRGFYMRKVKFTQDSFDEKLGAILNDFPMLDDIHPFLSSLMNVLYDKNHYKLALGQLRTARHLIDQVSKDYLRLLKFGDSLYRCKQLKRAAMGRMATIMRRQNHPLAYLEQVRQHLSRLPAIDPNTRTLIICGYPNVGKSSFINNVTRADVDVQPYAFTTKSLFVGHLDYKYLRWQVIDTPGVLDHPLEEMNTIEMQSITALAHLKSCILYFIDLSEQCGYSVEAQCKLFHSIKPLFANKPTIVVFNKIDICNLASVPEHSRPFVDDVISQCTTHVEVSCYTTEGVQTLKNTACDTLLAHRVENKMKGTKVNAIINRIHVAQPKKRDDVERLPAIPDAVKEKNGKRYDWSDPNRRKLAKDKEVEEGGPGVFSANLKDQYMLTDPSWKQDVMPEIISGKNVADFIDPDIEEKLEALEREEEKLISEGFYDSPSDEDYDDEEDERVTKPALTYKKIAQAAKKSRGNQSVIPKSKKALTFDEMSSAIQKAGFDPAKIQAKAKALMEVQTEKMQEMKKKRKRDEEEEDVDMDDVIDDDGDEGYMDVDDDEGATPTKKSKTNTGGAVVKKRGPKSDRAVAGMRDQQQLTKANQLRNLAQRPRNMLAKAGESDRVIRTKMPKHLFAGKRKMGKTQRR